MHASLASVFVLALHKTIKIPTFLLFSAATGKNVLAPVNGREILYDRLDLVPITLRCSTVMRTRKEMKENMKEKGNRHWLVTVLLIIHRNEPSIKRIKFTQLSHTL